MKRAARKTFILAVGVAIVITLTAGCEEENLLNIKKHKLVAAESMQLKKELEQRSKEIEEQKGLLEKCLQEKKVVEKQSSKVIGDIMDTILKDVAEENAKLHEENEKLKAQVAQLQTQVQQLEKELQELKKPSVPQPLPSTPKPL